MRCPPPQRYCQYGDSGVGGMKKIILYLLEPAKTSRLTVNLIVVSLMLITFFSLDSFDDIVENQNGIMDLQKNIVETIGENSDLIKKTFDYTTIVDSLQIDVLDELTEILNEHDSLIHLLRKSKPTIDDSLYFLLRTKIKETFEESNKISIKQNDLETKLVEGLDDLQGLEDKTDKKQENIIDRLITQNYYLLYGVIFVLVVLMFSMFFKSRT